jgi:hypothetical protein
LSSSESGIRGLLAIIQENCNGRMRNSNSPEDIGSNPEFKIGCSTIAAATTPTARMSGTEKYRKGCIVSSDIY